MSAPVKIPPEGQVNPMKIHGLRREQDDKGSWFGLYSVIKHFIANNKRCFDSGYVRKKWITPIVGEENLRQFDYMGGKSKKAWFISERGLALLVAQREDQIARRFVGFSETQELGRMSDWADGVLKKRGDN